MAFSLKPKKQDNEIVAVNFPGWQKFQDICILTKESNARILLGRLIDYCSQNLQQSVAQFEKIAQLNEFNPYELDDVGNSILSLGMEVYFTCYENRLFELGAVRDLPFELAHVGPHRLYLRRLCN